MGWGEEGQELGQMEVIIVGQDVGSVSDGEKGTSVI